MENGQWKMCGIKLHGNAVFPKFALSKQQSLSLTIKNISIMADLKVKTVIKDGFSIGVKNAPSLIGATILWILTIWVPYINVGTTIAMCSIPVALSKGKVLAPTFIFGSQYRKNMGNFLILEGISTSAISASMIFLFFPALVLAYSWSQAVYLLLDKEMNPIEALDKSNKITYGYKWKLFGIDMLICLIICVALCVLGGIAYAIHEIFGVVVIVGLLILVVPFLVGCNSVIYKQLTTEETPAE